jgi:hypothetical protein
MNEIDAQARHAFALASHAFKTCKRTDFAAAEKTDPLFFAGTPHHRVMQLAESRIVKSSV